jgi:hypothetical protein
MGKIAKVGKNRHKTNGTNLLRAHTSAMGAICHIRDGTASKLVAFLKCGTNRFENQHPLAILLG